MSGTVLILGASGKFGRHSALAFEEAGWTVKRFQRGKDNLEDAAQGCDVILNGFNPPNYHDWKTILPQITREVIGAARASGAAVILPGNVYHFGDQGGVWSARTPANPVSRKGQIRLTMERDYAQSGVQTIVLRAGNAIDPDRQGCVMSLIYLREIAKNRITLPGPAETRQALCFVPDWARAAVALAGKRHELSQFEDIPFEGHTLTAQEIKSGLERILQRDLQFVRFPWWMFSLTAPFWELARELKEMRYLWNTDHALSGERLQEVLPDFTVTPLDDVLRSSLP
ncbi:epimerase [Stappia sp. BW2]|uniref:epimerase n=1 Tax=Stappia sp. BW2 TaxID=2592622 RepID=UPI0011DED500|nr:epimerase [Stappia sp. BW2]TYC75360.1 epimerase [Stappia sp. BW2]